MVTRMVRWLVLALMVTACTSVEATPSAEVQASLPSSTTSPTTDATMIAEPSQIVEPTADAGLAPDDVAQVVTTDLVPFAAGWHPNYLPPPGWVAANSRDGEAWIAPAAPECREPMLPDIVVEPPMATLACYGDTPMTLEGTFGGCLQGSDPGLSPSWLGAQGCHLIPYNYDPDVIPNPGGLLMRFQGEIGVPYDRLGVPIRVDGSFDDPAALTCVSTEPDPSLSPELVVFGCRTRFVATQVSIIEP